MLFSNFKLKGEFQGGNILLQGNLKRQKPIAPKGSVISEMWKILPRSLDELDEIYTPVSTSLKLNERNDTSQRNDLTD